MNKPLHFTLLALFFTACSNDYTPPPQKEVPRAIVLGEIYQDSSINVTITSAKNTTIAENTADVKVKKVELLDAKKQKLSVLENKKATLWTTPFLTKANTNYILLFDFGAEKIEAKTKIPEPFTAKIIKTKKLPDATLELKLEIESNSKKENFYIIECFRREDGKLERINFESKNTFSDNYKLHKLNSPYNRLFFKSTKTLTTSLILPKDEMYEIRIKSTTKEHYSFLYHYEVQLDNDEYYIPSSQNPYLGSWGGCYLIKLQY